MDRRDFQRNSVNNGSKNRVDYLYCETVEDEIKDGLSTAIFVYFKLANTMVK